MQDRQPVFQPSDRPARSHAAMDPEQWQGPAGDEADNEPEPDPAAWNGIPADRLAAGWHWIDCDGAVKRMFWSPFLNTEQETDPAAMGLWYHSEVADADDAYYPRKLAGHTYIGPSLAT